MAQKLSKKQMTIAKKAPPKDKITGADLQKLRGNNKGGMIKNGTRKKSKKP